MAPSQNGSRWPVLAALANCFIMLAVASAVFVGVYWLRGPIDEFAAAPPSQSVRTLPSPPPGPPTVITATPLTQPLLPANDEIVIDLDREGKIRFAGEPMELAVLRSRLCGLNDELRSRVLVTIRPADECQFRHVKSVITICDECVISSYKVSSPAEANILASPKPNDTSAV